MWNNCFNIHINIKTTSGTWSIIVKNVVCYKTLSKQTEEFTSAHAGANTVYFTYIFLFVYLLIFCLPELKPELQSWDGSSWALLPRMLDLLVVQLEKGLSSLKMKSSSKYDWDATFLKFQENLNPRFQSGLLSINCSPDPVGTATLHVSS